MRRALAVSWATWRNTWVVRVECATLGRMRFARWTWSALILSVAWQANAQSPPAQAQGEPPTAPASDLQAGGLRPPEAVQSDEQPQTTTGETQVESELDRAEAEDTGRGLEFVWLNGEVGYQWVGLQAFSNGDLVDGSAIDDSGGGLVYGGGLGVRLFVVTLGGWFRYSAFDAYNQWSIDAQAGLRIPLGNLEAYGTVGAGYVALGGFTPKADVPDVDFSQLGAKGANVRLAAGADYYLSDTFSVGANVGGELLLLKRAAIDIPDTAQGAAQVYADSGSGVGAAFIATAVLGLHF